jgi:tight adherence protein C
VNAHIVLALTMWIGTTLVLAELRWFRRRPLGYRLRPYLPGARGFVEPVGGSIASLAQTTSQVAHRIGTRLSRILGVSEELALRLERIHSPLSVAAFRLRQLVWALVAFSGSALVVAGARPPLPIVPLFVFGAPLLAFLLLEQHVARTSARRQRRVFLELPVVAEQLGMLLSAGYSVGAALNRLAAHGQGANAADLRRVCNRIRHGLGEHDALHEWAEVSGVPAVGRLVAVLHLDRDASDLGRLISEEARAVRREVHRELVETIERRSQQVWIPVTVATLLPGVAFLAVPFMAAMQLFTSS